MAGGRFRSKSWRRGIALKQNKLQQIEWRRRRQMMHNPRREGNLGMRGKKWGLHPTNENLLLPKSSRWKAKQPNKNKNRRKRRRRRRMPRFQCPKAETRKIKHLQPLILPHNRTPIETHTHTQKIFKQNIPKGGFKLRKSWIHAKSYCGVRFGLTCSLLLKIYSLSERPIDCPLYFPRQLFFFFFFFLSYDASLLACNWRMGFFCKFVSGNICAHELWTPKKNRVATMANTPFSSLSLSFPATPPTTPPPPPPPPPPFEGRCKTDASSRARPSGHALSHVWVPWHVWGPSWRFYNPHPWHGVKRRVGRGEDEWEIRVRVRVFFWGVQICKLGLSGLVG